MAAPGGFNFGVKPTTAAAPGGLSFGTTPSTQAAGTGFNFGATAAPPASQATPGFNFGAAGLTGTSTASATPSGFGFGTPASSTATPGTGFSLGGTAPANTSAVTPGLGFSTPAAAASTAASGFKLGGTTGGGLLPTPAIPASTTTTAAASGGFGFAAPIGVATTTAGTGKTGIFGQPATSTTATGLFGQQPAASTTGTSLFGQQPSASTTPGTSLFGQPTASVTGSSLFGSQPVAASSAGTSLFGQAGLTGAVAGGSIFGQPTSKPTSVGLGGVGTKTATTTAGVTTDGSKTSEGKTVKETQVQNEILLDVDAFQKFVKEEKSETEHLKRKSSTPMVKVQEDSAALRQLLSVVSSGLQRNACAVDKLKHEMTQELKNAEMAMRTKEIPPGLQYENTVPTQYFQQLVENFETQMLMYRQQIETLENHLSSLNQPNRLTADELVLLLRKLHEAFIAMAAQLQQVHEAVKTQKEHYLNYRKVFLGDNRNIFERQKKAPVKVAAVSRELYGHSPFNNTTMAAMTSALSRSQQPAGQGGAPPVTGFSNFPQPGGFGTADASRTGAFGTPATQGAALKGFGTSGGSLFGTTSNLGTTTYGGGSLFGTTPQPTQPPQLNLSTSTEQPFQLSKPPVGSKRGKR